MKPIKDISNKYLKLKNKKDRSVDDKRFIRKFEKAYESLAYYDRKFFIANYLEANERDWWKQFYSRASYYRLEKVVNERFLRNLGLIYE